MLHEFPTVSDVAVHGLSFSGGGGTGEQVISMVPHSATLFAQVGAGPEIRIL